MLLQIQTQHNGHQQDAYTRFLYGIKSNETKRSYVNKLESFFDYYKIEGQDIKEKSENFLEYTRKGKKHKSRFKIGEHEDPDIQIEKLDMDLTMSG
jgi:predicted phosphoadenosine phosphosulfate sulfurtransferase